MLECHSVVRFRIPKPWLISALRQQTDYRRWSNPRSIYTEWESRTQQAAAFVPNNSRVIEFGAATRILERYLDPSCTYTPSDIVDRGPGTFVCDLNERPLPDLGDGYDVAVIMGVLEYITDVPAVVDWLAKYVPRIVVSYAAADSKRSLRGRLGSFGRLSGGWMNNYREAEFRSIFLNRGYTAVHEENWKEQRMFVFTRQPSAS